MWESNFALMIALTAVAATVGLVIYWMFICFMLSLAAGWRRLGKEFTLSAMPPTEVISWQSARVGWINYNRVLQVAALPEGLYLALFPALFAGHPALVVPWAAISGYRERRMWFVQVAEFEIATSGRPVRILILEKLAERLELGVRLGEGGPRAEGGGDMA